MKRVARSEVMLDEIDVTFLILLDTHGGFWPLDDLKKHLNVTHKALLVHAKRLQKHGFIMMVLLKETSKKHKTYALTKMGRKAIVGLYESPVVYNLLMKHGKEKV